MINRKIYCVWVGKHLEMNSNRAAALDSLIKNSGVEVVLITNDNIESFIIKDHPLHDGFNSLSDVHKADYIRCYMMHHHGGGYSDIKPCDWNWNPYFDELDKGYYFGVGAPEDEGPLSTPLTIRKEYGDHWDKMISADLFIFKPYTVFTSYWYTKMMQIIDGHLNQLRKNPATTPREAADTVVTKYPIRWAGILCEIFHPLCVTHTDRILKTMPYPIRENYR
jgi:hypothetical protein